MANTRKGTAQWRGSGKTGKGELSVESGALKNKAYTHKSRFGDGEGTNPEELIGAAHAGCFSMKLAFVLNDAGFEAEEINTEAQVTIDSGTINEIHLTTRVKVDGLEEGKFRELTENAKNNCPVSKLVKAKIILSAELI